MLRTLYYFSVLPSVVNNVTIVSIVSTVNIVIIVNSMSCKSNKNLIKKKKS